MILENLNKEKIEEPLRTEFAQSQVDGAFSNEYSQVSAAYHQLARDIEELEATLNIAVLTLFHTIHKPQNELVNLEQYKKKRNAEEIYYEALSFLKEVTAFKEKVKDKNWKYIGDHFSEIFNRQGKFRF